MEVPCHFANEKFIPIKKSYYTCKILKQDFTEKELISVNGEHKMRRTSQDVECIKFIDCTVPKMPQGLTKIFPNLNGIWIENSKLEQVSRDDLTEYKSFESFVCINNKIEFLAGNLFKDFDNLKMIFIFETNLKIVEPYILDGLSKLNYVSFLLNINYDITFSSTGEEKYSKIEEFKDELFRKFFAAEMPEIKNFVERLQSRVQQLQKSNHKLRDVVRVLEILGEEYDKKIEENLELKRELENLNKKHFLRTDIQNFLGNHKYSDLQIQIDDQEFKVHKFLLAARSPTLAEIFLANPEAENLKLTDISVDTFEKILHFFYTDELPDDEDTNFVQLYDAASMLKINLLINFAEPKVLENINQENAAEVLILSNKFKNNEMRQKAFDEIKKTHPDLSDNWIDKPKLVKKFIEVVGQN